MQSIDEKLNDVSCKADNLEKEFEELRNDFNKLKSGHSMNSQYNNVNELTKKFDDFCKKISGDLSQLKKETQDEVNKLKTNFVQLKSMPKPDIKEEQKEPPLPFPSYLKGNDISTSGLPRGEGGFRIQSYNFNNLNEIEKLACCYTPTLGTSGANIYGYHRLAKNCIRSRVYEEFNDAEKFRIMFTSSYTFRDSVKFEDFCVSFATYVEFGPIKTKNPCISSARFLRKTELNAEYHIDFKIDLSVKREFQARPFFKVASLGINCVFSETDEKVVVIDGSCIIVIPLKTISGL